VSGSEDVVWNCFYLNKAKKKNEGKQKKKKEKKEKSEWLDLNLIDEVDCFFNQEAF